MVASKCRVRNRKSQKLKKQFTHNVNWRANKKIKATKNSNREAQSWLFSLFCKWMMKFDAWIFIFPSLTHSMNKCPDTLNTNSRLFFSAHNCNIRFHVNFTQRHLHVSSLAGYFILFFYNGCFDKKNYCMKGRYISAELNPQIFTINFLQLNEMRD